MFLKDKILKLTNAVYKVLDFFPESDPLKNRAKDRALVIMERLTEAAPRNGASLALLEQDIDVLLGYLWIAKTQRWLNSVNFLIIANEYEKIKLEIKKEPKESIKVVLNNTESVAPKFSLTERQKSIVDFLNKNEKAQVMDLQTILPNITKRTIRRDLDELLTIGKIIRQGDFNQVFYKIKA